MAKQLTKFEAINAMSWAEIQIEYSRTRWLNGSNKRKHRLYWRRVEAHYQALKRVAMLIDPPIY